MSMGDSNAFLHRIKFLHSIMLVFNIVMLSVCMTCNEFANGLSVVILLLFMMERYLMFLHSVNPLSDMPQSFSAYRIVRDIANGAHVVIDMLLSARNLVMFVHNFNPSSVIPCFIYVTVYVRDPNW